MSFENIVITLVFGIAFGSILRGLGGNRVPTFLWCAAWFVVLVAIIDYVTMPLVVATWPWPDYEKRVLDHIFYMTWFYVGLWVPNKP